MQIADGVFDIAGSVANQRIVIIQWLDFGDVEEGIRLAKHMHTCEIASGRISLVLCRSRGDIIRALEWVVATTTPGDVLVLHLITHGARATQTLPGGLMGADPCGVGPQFRRGVAWHDLARYFSALSAKATQPHVVFLSGCSTADFMKYWNGRPTQAMTSAAKTLVVHYDEVVRSKTAHGVAMTFYGELFSGNGRVIEAFIAAHVICPKGLVLGIDLIAA